MCHQEWEGPLTLLKGLSTIDGLYFTPAPLMAILEFYFLGSRLKFTNGIHVLGNCLTGVTKIMDFMSGF